MRVTVFSEVRCALDADGCISTRNGMRAYSFWHRYLDVFSEVRVAARLSREVRSGEPVTGPGVSFVALPDYHGAAQYLSAYYSLIRTVRAICAADSAFIFRIPSRPGMLAARELQRLGRPYGIEVAGDPHDVFSPGAVLHP